jgi:hypothetical protein
MKKTKLIVFLLVSAVVMFISTTHISAQNIDFKLDGEQIDQDVLKDSQAEINTVLPKIAKFLAKPLINYITNLPMGSHPGSVIHQGGGDYHVTHPSVDFNKGKGINTTVIKSATGYGQDIFRPYMQKNGLFGLGTAGIEIFRNGVQLDDRLVKSNQTFDYKIPGGYNTEYGGYEIHYSVHDSQRWTPKMYYININPPCTQCQPSFDGEINDITTNHVMKDNRIYVKQSENTASKNSVSYSPILTMDELYTEFYDNKTKELTNQTKTIAPGSQIVINDVIMELTYNKEKEFTTLNFNSEYPELDYHSIYFKGDLSSEYEIGDSLTLVFELVKTEEINGNTFVELDYNLQAEKNDEYPSLDAFVKK